jgi:hypothetical protein
LRYCYSVFKVQIYGTVVSRQLVLPLKGEALVAKEEILIESVIILTYLRAYG